MIPCVFCNKIPQLTDHINKDLFDIYLCDNCNSNFHTRYRLLYHKGQNILLVNTIRIDEWFISLNHAPTTTAKRENYTKIFKNIIGEINSSVEGDPIMFGRNAAFELDFIIKLPWHDPELVKQKLQIYTTFS